MGAINNMDEKAMNQNETVNYVEVNDEALHKELLKNQYVRLYRATLAPGGETLVHRHSEDTVYVVVQGGFISTRNVSHTRRYPMDFPNSFGFFSKVRLGVRNLMTGSVHMPKGFFFCMLHKNHPVIHKAVVSQANLEDMVMIGTEILAKPNHKYPILLSKEFYKKDYESNAFSIFRLKLGPGESTGFHPYIFPVLMIPVDGAACINTKGSKTSEPMSIRLTSGSFHWNDHQTILNITNTRQDPFEAIIIVLK